MTISEASPNKTELPDANTNAVKQFVQIMEAYVGARNTTARQEQNEELWENSTLWKEQITQALSVWLEIPMLRMQLNFIRQHDLLKEINEELRQQAKTSKWINIEMFSEPVFSNYREVRYRVSSEFERVDDRLHLSQDSPAGRNYRSPIFRSLINLTLRRIMLMAVLAVITVISGIIVSVLAVKLLPDTTALSVAPFLGAILLLAVTTLIHQWQTMKSKRQLREILETEQELLNSLNEATGEELRSAN